MDPAEIAPWVLAFVLTLDKGVAALERMGALPGKVRRGVERKAEELHAERVKDAALTQLAANSEAILEQLQPNGGKSLWDAVHGLRKDFAAHVEEEQRAHRVLFAVIDGAPREERGA